MKKIISLVVFAAIVFLITFGVMKSGDIMDYFNRGEHYSYVMSDQTTLIVIANDKSKNDNLLKSIASLGKEYEGKLAITTLDENADLTKTLAFDLNVDELHESSSILINYKGDVISVYKNTFPYENIKLDLDRIFGK